MVPVQGDRSLNQVNIPSVGASRLQQETQEAEGLPPAYLKKSASSQRYSWKQPSHLLSAITCTHQIHRLSLQFHSVVEGSGTKHLFLISSSLQENVCCHNPKSFITHTAIGKGHPHFQRWLQANNQDLQGKQQGKIKCLSIQQRTCPLQSLTSSLLQAANYLSEGGHGQQ